MAALLLVEDRERLAGMQIRVVSAMETFLSGYGDDGCCPEGYGYWNYGFGYFVYWAEMLREYTGGAIDLLHSTDKIRRIAEFPAAVKRLSHADTYPVGLEAGLYARKRQLIRSQRGPQP